MQSMVEINYLEIGKGKAAARGALITAHYKGWLSDGTLFESSYDKGRPFRTVLSKNKVIQGWFIGLQGMQVGGKRRLRVPAELAYGERAVGTRIPPNSDLVFEVEMLEVLNRGD